MQEVKPTRFDWVKVGDVVTRMLAGVITKQLVVVEVDEKLIYCCPMGYKWPKEECWSFDIATGAEVDDFLNWGPPPKMTGSYLKDTRQQN